MKATFDNILEETVMKIKQTVQGSISVRSLRHTVPASILGCPLYNPFDARNYVAKKLRSKLMKYRVICPEETSRVMIIEWGKRSDEEPTSF